MLGLRCTWNFAGVVVATTACGGAAARAPTATPLIHPHALASLAGEWRWSHAGVDGEVSWIERERWYFTDGAAATAAAGPTEASPRTISGRYVREVTFTSIGEPFVCNQSQQYVQRAQFDLSATVTGNQIDIVETTYRAEPSPCDHGFRSLGSYQAVLGATTATLRFPDGAQTLLRAGPAPTTLPTAVWPGEAPTLAGAWAWRGVIHTDTERREQRETWSLVVADDGTVSGTTVRSVEIRDAAGLGLACAGGGPLRLDETVTMSGQPAEDRTLLREVDVASSTVPAVHSCGAMASERVTDSAYAELFGDAVVLQWRGKRRQVLIRPAP